MTGALNGGSRTWMMKTSTQSTAIDTIVEDITETDAATTIDGTNVVTE